MTAREWWAAYCLRFDSKQLSQPWTSEELEFLRRASADPEFREGKPPLPKTSAGFSPELAVLWVFSNMNAEDKR